jgi:hypothetical protein
MASDRSNARLNAAVRPRSGTDLGRRKDTNGEALCGACTWGLHRPPRPSPKGSHTRPTLAPGSRFSASLAHSPPHPASPPLHLAVPLSYRDASIGTAFHRVIPHGRSNQNLKRHHGLCGRMCPNHLHWPTTGSDGALQPLLKLTRLPKRELRQRARPVQRWLRLVVVCSRRVGLPL